MRIFNEIGSYFLLMYRVFSRPEKSRIYWRQLLLEIEKLGINSLAIVAIISVFMGGIITLQLTLQHVQSPYALLPDRAWQPGYTDS